MQNKNPLNKFDHLGLTLVQERKHFCYFNCNDRFSFLCSGKSDKFWGFRNLNAKESFKDTFRNSRKIDSSFYNEAMLDRSKHFQNVHIDNSTSVTNAISLMGDE